MSDMVTCSRALVLSSKCQVPDGSSVDSDTGLCTGADGFDTLHEHVTQQINIHPLAAAGFCCAASMRVMTTYNHRWCKFMDVRILQAAPKQLWIEH